jgi:hypothetical protein
MKIDDAIEMMENLKKNNSLKRITSSVVEATPVVRPDYPTSPSTTLRSPLAPELWTSEDAARQFYNTSVPQRRITPPSAATTPKTGASAATQTKIIAPPISKVIVGSVLPGTVDSAGGTTPATLNNVADGSTRFARETGHSSLVLTSNPLTATDAGASATVNVAGFAAQVAGKTVTYNSGSITALSYSTLYWVFFNDPTLSGGAVTYLASTSKPDTLNSTGNLFVGSVQTPAALASNTTGNGDGGSSSNQTGATNVQTVATLGTGTTGTTSGVSNRGGTATVNSGTTTSRVVFSGFVPSNNNQFATSRVLQFDYDFILASVLASYTVTYADGVLSGTIVSGSSAISAPVSFTLPIAINVANLTLTMTANYSSGAGHAELDLSVIQLLTSS